jgi:hypothetical protein
MGVALENARLYGNSTPWSRWPLAEIGSDIASTHEMEPVLERMATKRAGDGCATLPRYLLRMGTQPQANSFAGKIWR